MLTTKPGLAVAAVAAVALGAGCGSPDRGAVPSPAPRLTDRNPRIQAIDPPTAASYARPIAEYRRHVRRALAAMLPDVRALRAATEQGDLRAARAAWQRASDRYETTGAAYGAFGSLDSAVNGHAGGLPGGVRSRDFTGLHRIELALWERRSTRDAVPAARRLVLDVAQMRSRLRTLAIDPLEYSLRAHEVLEDTLHLQLSGYASPWSGSALHALRANVAGTRVVLRTLARMLAPRDSSGAVPQAQDQLSAIDRELARLARANGGSLPRWDAVSARERERVDALTAGAAEALAYVPGIIDPRPRRPIQLPSR